VPAPWTEAYVWRQLEPLDGALARQTYDARVAGQGIAIQYAQFVSAIVYKVSVATKRLGPRRSKLVSRRLSCLVHVGAP
jgi:hypothetical protein